ncbi:uncharacterized protein LOC135700828 [Ochlerotatus camptorhynchus]|uniref:uncharacterized protein LOC135700828 n=1 Tax=Ochlerotatus camptorhynchus TaxID=644619 RepID=UPI0031DFAC07
MCKISSKSVKWLPSKKCLDKKLWERSWKIQASPTRWITKQFGIDNSTVSQTTQRRAGSGRKTKTTDPVNARKVRDYFKRNPNLSIRDVAKKVNSSVWFVQQTMKRAGLHVWKVRKAFSGTDKQNTVAKARKSTSGN